MSSCGEEREGERVWGQNAEDNHLSLGRKEWYYLHSTLVVVFLINIFTRFCLFFGAGEQRDGQTPPPPPPPPPQVPLLLLLYFTLLLHALAVQSSFE